MWIWCVWSAGRVKEGFSITLPADNTHLLNLFSCCASTHQPSSISIPALHPLQARLFVRLQRGIISCLPAYHHAPSASITSTIDHPIHASLPVRLPAVNMLACLATPEVTPEWPSSASHPLLASPPPFPCFHTINPRLCPGLGLILANHNILFV